MSRLIKKARQYGFTLVELLIVVAIIGVLSTIGIPSFRRMVQKSKKSEAKVNLGGIYTAEQAFFSEYGSFGNNLNGLGFQSDGQAVTFHYRFGFINDACGTLATIEPQAITAVGQSINATFPAYYNAGTKVLSTGFVNLAANCRGSATAKGIDPVNGIAEIYSVPAGGVPNRFVAVATGVIAPGLNKTNPVNLTDVDTWGISEGRVMKNVQDGVQ